MITHPTRETLVAHLDGELSPTANGRIAAHIAGCARCDATVVGLRNSTGAFASALHSLDTAEPLHWAADDAFALLQTVPGTEHSDGTGAVLPFPAARPQRDGARKPSVPARRTGIAPALRWAASILLVTVATAAAAVFGRQLLSTPESVGPADATTAIEPTVAAVLATPMAGALRIAIDGAGGGSRLFVTYHDRADARVAVEGGGTPRFTVAPGRVDLDLDDATAIVRLTLPRTLSATVITANGSTVATVSLERVTPSVSAESGIPFDISDTSRME